MTSEERLARMENEIIHLADRYDEIKDDLYGNGRPGKLQTMADRITDIEKPLYAMSRGTRFFNSNLTLLILAVNLIVSVLALFWGKH